MFKKSSHQGKGGGGGFKGGAPKGGASTASWGESNLPKSVKNRAKYGRRRRHSAPTLTHCRRYGPPKTLKMDRFWLDLKLWRSRFPELAQDLEKKQKEKEEEEEEIRIPEKEAEKLPELTVTKINFHVQGRKEGKKKCPGNGAAHHTDQYARCHGAKPRPVFRRGQEFKMTITFNRPYNVTEDDLIFQVIADDDCPGKESLCSKFKLIENPTKPLKKGKKWAARIKKELPKKNALKLAVYIPYTCVVAEWDMKVQSSLRGKPMKMIYEHDVPICVLFNPWCEDDQVYYPGNKEDLKEYVLNDESCAYRGTFKKINYSHWTYGQFKEGMLDISLAIMRKAFKKMTTDMGNPVIVSRALSRMVNATDDDGVLVGNWSGNYEGGDSPLKWSSSVCILKQYMATGEPVKYGQCWVFSHVLTAVCRALGLPCRSVTNFQSAHDTDGSCTIDNFRDKDDNEIKWMNRDSCWNFHVWNEVWMHRPEIPDHYLCDGWQAIDATPQETSEGVYQCGPCPVNAVKEGRVFLLYDTAFVFAEVNADRVDWIQNEDGEFISSHIGKTSVGKHLSTKPPDGKDPPCFYDRSYRYDLTDQYKYPEGSEEERLAVKRAVRSTEQAGKIFEESAKLFVDFADDPGTTVGQDMIVTALVKNLTQEVRNVDMMMSARSSTYYNNPDQDEELHKEKLPSITVKPGETARVPVKVPAEKYTTKDKTVLSVYVYVRCTDQSTKMPYTAQEPFDLVVPDLVAKCPNSCKAGEVVTATAEFVNPLDTPLTDCEVFMEGNMLPAKDDPNNFNCFYGFYNTKHRDVKPKEKVSLKFRLYWEEDEPDCDDDEDSEDGDEAGEGETAPPPTGPKPTKIEKLEFFSQQLKSIRTAVTVTCDRPHHH